MPRGVGFVLLRDMGFGVTIQNSNFGVGGGGGLFPGESIGYFGSGAVYLFSLVLVEDQGFGGMIQ